MLSARRRECDFNPARRPATARYSEPKIAQAARATIPTVSIVKRYSIVIGRARSTLLGICIEIFSVSESSHNEGC
jgi:hypothetical protein